MLARSRQFREVILRAMLGLLGLLTLSVFLAVLGRGHSKLLFERSGKAVAMAVAENLGDLLDRIIRHSQTVRSQLHFYLNYIFLW